MPIKYGGRLETFLLRIEESGGTFRDTEQSFVKAMKSRGWKNKISERRVASDFRDRFDWEIGLYFFSWIIKVLVD